MKLTVLTDNNSFSDNPLLAEPGLSYFIEADSKIILFDTGFSDVYMKNALVLGVDLNTVDVIVLSHGHDDHVGGLPFFTRDIDLIGHPDCFLPKIEDGEQIGIVNLGENFNCIKQKNPFWITDNIVFLGEIESNRRKPMYETEKDGQILPDLLFDDSGLAIRTDKGIVVIVGCSHAGIREIVNSAKNVFQVDEVYSVIGGFHLQDETEDELRDISDFFRKNVSGPICPGHCSDFAAKCYLANNLPDVRPVFVGKKFYF